MVVIYFLYFLYFYLYFPSFLALLKAFTPSHSLSYTHSVVAEVVVLVVTYFLYFLYFYLYFPSFLGEDKHSSLSAFLKSTHLFSHCFILSIYFIFTFIFLLYKVKMYMSSSQRSSKALTHFHTVPLTLSHCHVRICTISSPVALSPLQSCLRRLARLTQPLVAQSSVIKC